THTSFTCASAGAAAKTARAPAEARALAIQRVFQGLLLHLELRLHPRMDDAHEVERLAGRCGHGHLELVALVRTGDARVAGLVEVGGVLLALAVLHEIELRRLVAVRIGAVRLAE